MSANLSPIKQLLDESYRNKIGELSLFIQVSKSEIQFAFFDPNQKRIVGLEAWQIETNENWHQLGAHISELLLNEYQSTDFKSVSLALVSSLYTLVPSPLFQSSKKQDYIELNHQLHDPLEFTFLSEEVSGVKSQLVYAFPTNLYRYLSGTFGKIQFHHYLTPCLEAISLRAIGKESMHIHIGSDRFDVCYFANEKLQLVNSFTYQSTEDFIYYLLYVMEQLKINRDRIPLFIQGEFEESSHLIDLIHNYVRSPQIVERSKAINYSKPLDQLPRHQYANLFNLYLCA